MKISKNWLLVALVASALAFVGTRVRADDAGDIETYANYAALTMNGSGDDSQGGNDADAIVDTIMSQPGTFGTHSYTYWEVLVADASGSLETDFSSASLASLGWTPTIGQQVSFSATYNPYHAVPEVVSATAATVGTTGNPQWNGGSQIATLPSILANPHNTGGSSGQYLPLAQSMEGYLVEVQNVTISSSGGLANWPATNSGTAILPNLYLTDSANNKLTLYFWWSSYSSCGMAVGAPIPDNSTLTYNGLFDVYGMLTAYPSVSGGITTWQDELVPTAFVGIPEPSSLMLAGIGLLSLLAVIRRRHS